MKPKIRYYTIIGFSFVGAGAFVLDGVTPQDVARAMIERGDQRDPFYLVSVDEAYHRIQHFKLMMPRIKIFYAMKANDTEMMLKLVVSQGCGFDCASPGEIYKIRKLGVDPLSIIYAMPVKTPEQMVYARDTAMKHTTFDSSSELKRLQLHWPKACLLIRIRVDGVSVYKLGEKFGCDFETEAIDLLEEAAALGLKVVGVAFHVGSLCSTIESHVLGLKRARALFDHEERAGRQMSIVDIGGGFLSDRTDRIDQQSQLINEALDQLFPNAEVQVIAEPGRYLCDSSFTHYCSIASVRQISRNNNPVNMLYLNDGLFGTLRYMETWHTVKKFEKTSNKIDEETVETILWGPTCDSTDRIMQDYQVRLPHCTTSDWLVFEIQGGYTFGYASSFSCLPHPQRRTVISKELWHKVRKHSVFNAKDFVVDPDISEPLPNAMPPVIPDQETSNGTVTLIQ